MPKIDFVRFRHTDFKPVARRVSEDLCQSHPSFPTLPYQSWIEKKTEVDRASHDTVGVYDFIHSGKRTDFSTGFYRKMDSRKKSREHISFKTSKNVLQTYCNDLDSTEFACFALSSRYPRSMPKII